MKTIFKSLITLAGCFYQGGSHLAVLQVLAWSGKLVSYSAEQGIAAGWRDTSSGAKPCPMCKAIKTVRKAETDEGRGLPGSGETQLEKLSKEMLASSEGFRLRRVPLDHLEIANAVDQLAPDAEAPRPPVRGSNLLQRPHVQSNLQI